MRAWSGSNCIFCQVPRSKKECDIFLRSLSLKDFSMDHKKNVFAIYMVTSVLVREDGQCALQCKCIAYSEEILGVIPLLTKRTLQDNINRTLEPNELLNLKTPNPINEFSGHE